MTFRSLQKADVNRLQALFRNGQAVVKNNDIATDSVENFYSLQCIIDIFLIIRQNACIIRQV
jgi:hypothetical protein